MNRYGWGNKLPVSLLFPCLVVLMVSCSRTGSKATGLLGTVIIVSDSGACECIRERGETILHQIDSLSISDSPLIQQFAFKKVDRTKDRKIADGILDRCDSPLIPVVRIEDPEGKEIHEFSGEFDSALFIGLLKHLQNTASIELKRGT
jgi:hypothetical protein